MCTKSPCASKHATSLFGAPSGEALRESCEGSITGRGSSPYCQLPAFPKRHTGPALWPW